MEEAEALGEGALALCHGMEDPLIFDWIALWPLIAVALAQANVAKAADRVRGLLADGQQPLADEIVADCRAALDSAARDDQEGLGRSLQRALQPRAPCIISKAGVPQRAPTAGAERSPVFRWTVRPIYSGERSDRARAPVIVRSAR